MACQGACLRPISSTTRVAFLLCAASHACTPDAQEAYAAYEKHFLKGPTIVLRDCLELVPAGEPIPLEEVQPAADIMTRFCTGGMSLGAISRETHETISVAMNRIGGACACSGGGSAISVLCSRLLCCFVGCTICKSCVVSVHVPNLPVLHAPL